MNQDHAARLIARLLALRYLPREDREIRRLLVDAGFRDEVEQRLAARGLRLLAHPFSAYVGIALSRECESAVFEQNDTWQSSNLGLPKDAVALLIILWALIILPKRERQLSGETAQQEEQTEMFETVKLTPLAHEASRGIAENVLLEDYGKLLGGKARLQQFALPRLHRAQEQGDPRRPLARPRLRLRRNGAAHPQRCLVRPAETARHPARCHTWGTA